MSSWRTRAVKYIASENAPNVLTRNVLQRIADLYVENISYRLLTHWISEQVEVGNIVPVTNGLYLNKLKNPPANLSEAATHINPQAIVSLHYVLGEHGVLNNYTDIVTAVIPLEKERNSVPKLGVVNTKAGVFHFHGIAKNVCLAGATTDRLTSKEYPYATPEKAFLDLLYLGNHRKSSLSVPSQTDIDIDELNFKRLYRLAKRMKIEDQIEDWLEKYHENDNQDRFDPYSSVLGF
ncbi:MAG: hypothetical protein ACOC2E_07385 [Bacteroidota bacterium]